MRCADCGLYECAMRSPLGGCPNGTAGEQTVIITAPDSKPVNLGNGPWDKDYKPADAMKLLEEKIKKISEKKTWDGVDVDKYLAEIRGENTELYKAASDLVDAVERYMRQECLRSELALKEETLKKLIER